MGGSGKKFYHNVIDGSRVATEPFYVAIITPTIHYCMGGLEVTADAEVVSKSGVIPGLYAAGEIAGGVHGNNRLGGNSLLDCVVFGRVAGKAAFKYIAGDKGEFQMYPAPSSLKARLHISLSSRNWQTKIREDIDGYRKGLRPLPPTLCYVFFDVQLKWRYGPLTVLEMIPLDVGIFLPC